MIEDIVREKEIRVTLFDATDGTIADKRGMKIVRDFFVRSYGDVPRKGDWLSVAPVESTSKRYEHTENFAGQTRDKGGEFFWEVVRITRYLAFEAANDSITPMPLWSTEIADYLSPVAVLVRRLQDNDPLRRTLPKVVNQLPKPLRS